MEFDFGAAPKATPEPQPELNLPVPSLTFDLAPIALNLVPFENLVALMSREARAIKVTDEASLKVAVETDAKNKRLHRDLEEARKGFVKPLNDHVSDINNLFRTLTEELAQNQAHIKGQRARYDSQLELERKRREADLREERRKFQAKLDEEARIERERAERKVREAEEELNRRAESGTLDPASQMALEQTIEEETAAAQAPPQKVAPLVAEERPVTRTAAGTGYTKFKWVCRVVKPEDVPREYCEPSQKLLDAATKGGVRQIDGCEITEEAIPHTRL